VTTAVIFSGAALLLCAFSFVYFHLSIRRRTSRRALLTDYRDEVDRLIAEIDHATDRDTRLVEERIAALKKILEEADRRVALMSRELENRRSASELYTALGTRRPLPPQSAPPPRPASLPPDQSPEAPPGRPAEQSPAAAPEQSPELPPEKPVPAGPAPLDPPLAQRALELSRQGFAAEFIAARLDLSLAEVELALAVSRHAPRR
jgi:hypothetical protein